MLVARHGNCVMPARQRTTPRRADAGGRLRMGRIEAERGGHGVFEKLVEIGRSAHGIAPWSAAQSGRDRVWPNNGLPTLRLLPSKEALRSDCYAALRHWPVRPPGRGMACAAFRAVGRAGKAARYWVRTSGAHAPRAQPLQLLGGRTANGQRWHDARPAWSRR